MMQRQTVSRYELDALAKLRQAPEQLYDMTPNGMEFSRVKYDMQRWQDRRMHYIKTRLAVASHSFNRNFDRER